MRKKLFTFLLALVASAGALFAESGTCGENLTWDLTNGVLTISGTGTMTDYYISPWFSSRSSIQSVVVSDGCTSIGKSAFAYCSSLTSVTIPNSITNIGERAFMECIGLTSVTIPNSVTSIGKQAFYLCSSLTSVTIPNSVTSIGEQAFFLCSSLTSVAIGNGITNLERGIFQYCRNLTSISIPNSVTSIGSYAFHDCYNLPSLTIPNSVISIGDKAFTNVPNVIYNGSACGSPWGARSVNGYIDGYLVYADASKSSLLACFTAAEGEITIPNSVINIRDSAFYHCAGLTSVTIPESVISIGEDAFSNCTGLISVTIGNSVTSIGGYAFSGCTGLTSVTIPNSVTSIGSSAFDLVANIVYNGTATGSPWGARSVNGYVDGYLVYSDASKLSLLACFTAAEGEIIIPNSVTSIGGKAFYDCSGLSSVTIPTGVTRIGNSAFSHCTSLTSVTIPNGITSINNYTFSECKNLTSIIIPDKVTSIGESAFSGCSSLISVTIGKSVKSIDEYAFLGCENLEYIIWNAINYTGLNDYISPFTDIHENIKSFILGEEVVNISAKLCYEMSSLTSVIIPNSVISIKYSAFEGCSSLTDVTISNSVTSIEWGAFRNCTNLTSVTIPDSVTSIGGDAFRGCENLTSINMNPIIPPTIGEYTFNNIHANATVYVPFGCKESYQSTDYWKNLNIQGPKISQNIVTSATACSIIFTVENTELQSIGISGGEQQPGNRLEYIGLEPNSEYKDVHVVLTSTEGLTETVDVSFRTTALELTTKASKPVSSTTAILLAETNMSDAEVSCGFEYKRNDAPADMDGTKVFCPVASGQMAGRLKGLKDDVYYKYRAFYQSAAGNMYYGDWQYIFTGDVAVEFDPILYTYGATVVKENEATISGYALAGSEDFTEQGFEYWAESRANNSTNAPRRMPAGLNEHFFVQASGIALRATLTNLDAGTIYRYRVYGKVGDQYYYGSEQTFTTTGTYTPPTYTITFANWDGTVLQSLQVAEGVMPEYIGSTPVRQEDGQYTYVFNGWTPAIVAATADATYTAQYLAKDKHEGLDDAAAKIGGSTKLLRDGVLYIERNGMTYTITGAEVK